MLHLSDWVFDIDLETTMAYSAAEAIDHCDCAYCRNFYAAVDSHYPSLRSFLAQFGIDLEAPDVQYPYDHAGKMRYDSLYFVRGNVLKTGMKALRQDNVWIIPIDDPEVLIRYDADCTLAQPYFALLVMPVILPWTLLEPMKEVLSPANQQDFLNAMWQHLLEHSCNTSMQ